MENSCQGKDYMGIKLIFKRTFVSLKILVLFSIYFFITLKNCAFSKRRVDAEIFPSVEEQANESKRTGNWRRLQ